MADEDNVPTGVNHLRKQGPINRHALPDLFKGKNQSAGKNIVSQTGGIVARNLGAAGKYFSNNQGTQDLFTTPAM
jgi:hypothetical protein